MKRSIVFFLLVFSLIAIACNGSFYSTVEGNGNITTKSFDVSEFTSIDASSAFEIDVAVGESQSVEIKTDENLIKYVKVFVKNNTLYLETKNNVNIDGNLKAIISVNSLNGVDLSGACKINVENIKSENFRVDVSGACKGSLSGKVENLNLDLSGATKFNTVDLKAKNLNIDISGASKLDVFCENALTVDASGASKIIVYGDPQKTKTDISGASSIEFNWFLKFEILPYSSTESHFVFSVTAGNILELNWFSDFTNILSLFKRDSSEF